MKLNVRRLFVHQDISGTDGGNWYFIVVSNIAVCPFRKYQVLQYVVPYNLISTKLYIMLLK
jgi:hypothetical protein